MIAFIQSNILVKMEHFFEICEKSGSERDLEEISLMYYMHGDIQQIFSRRSNTIVCGRSSEPVKDITTQIISRTNVFKIF